MLKVRYHVHSKITSKTVDAVAMQECGDTGVIAFMNQEKAILLAVPAHNLVDVVEVESK